jgi:hypothetical protein
MRRNWERTLVETAHDLGFRILLVRAEHANSRRTPSPELRERLRKRMDGAGRTLGLRWNARGCRPWIKVDHAPA